MFIKLTRFGNSPIWVNASFIVTVEPRKEGSGSIVVPIGDGLDYDVRESPEAVLSMLDGAPAAAVVPIPVSDCLTKTPDDVSPETVPSRAEQEEAPAVEAKPRKRATKAKAKAAAKKEPAAKDEAVAMVESSIATAVAAQLASPLSDEEVVRLRKMAPKSISKLRNTLISQFKVNDVDFAVQSLETSGKIKLDGTRITWMQSEVDSADW